MFIYKERTKISHNATEKFNKFFKITTCLLKKNETSQFSATWRILGVGRGIIFNS